MTETLKILAGYSDGPTPAQAAILGATAIPVATLALIMTPSATLPKKKIGGMKMSFIPPAHLR
ncbi:hypothetical protein AB0K27_05215 [Micromonospora echinospora]|uniref:hypothetical protein n=1 Tax=Micromonospora echinospora TaxID=1877 RepID=UPI003417D43C